jgi:NAD(P)H-hydrate epimerase
MKQSSGILTASQAKAFDSRALHDYGISTLVLMENAGRQVAQEAIASYVRGMKIAVLCGKGNNGGDGFVAARHMIAQGLKPDIYLACSIRDVGGEAGTNLRILLKLKQKIRQVSDKNISGLKMDPYGLIVDALLGVGLSGEVRGIYKNLIAAINSSGARILSVDIPSGLDATTGRVLGCCVKADKTITFVAKKSGMVIADGPRYCGRIVVAGLGLPL